MVKINLNHIYKKYPNADDYSVSDFDLHIGDHEFIVFVGRLAVVSQRPCGWLPAWKTSLKGLWKSAARS